MLDAMLSLCLAVLVPQGPRSPAVDAVAVRGDTELHPADAYASARRKAEEHVRERWQERAERTLRRQRPFWLPEPLAEAAVQRWVADLPVDEMLRTVDRHDQERTHEFGNSYQTTLWITEEPAQVQAGERRLRGHLRGLERTTAIKYGGIAGAWVLLGIAIGWLDRVSRGYMTGRLRLLGLLGAVAVPTVAFLV